MNKLFSIIMACVAVSVVSTTRAQDTVPLPDTNTAITSANAGQVELLERVGHGRLVETGWSPDGKRFAVVTKAGVWIYDVPDFDQKPQFIAGYVRLSQFSPDWSRVVVLRPGAGVFVVDTFTNDAVHVNMQAGDVLTYSVEMRYSPTGDVILLGVYDENFNRIAVFWDVKTQQVVGRWLPGAGQSFQKGFEVSPGGRWAFVNSYQRTTSIWDMKTMQPTETPLVIKGYSFNPVFSSDDRYLAWLGSDETANNSVHVLNMSSGEDEVIHTIADQIPVQIFFTPTRNDLVIFQRDGSGNGEMTIWSVDGDSMRAQHDFSAGYGDFQFTGFTSDGRYLLRGGYSPDLTTWDMETAKPLVVPWQGGGNYSPDSRFVLAVSGLWNADFRPEDKPLFYIRGGFSSYSPDNRWLVSQNDQTVYIYDLDLPEQFTDPTTIELAYLSYGQPTFSPKDNLLLVQAGYGNIVMDSHSLGMLGEVDHLAYNPSFGVDVQGQLWVAGSYASSGQPQVAAWQIARDGEQLTVSEPRILNSVLGEEQLSYNAFTISPDATYVAAGYGDDLSASPAIQIWSLKRDTKPLVVYGHQERINDLTFSPDGRVLVTASGYTSEFHPGEDNGVRLWRVERNPTRLTELARFMTELQADDVAFSPNGRLVVGNDYRGDLVVWDTVTGDEVAKLSGRFYSVTFAPDNSLLVAGDAYGGIHLFDTHSWQEVKVLYGHIGGIDYLAFDPQGEVLASSGNDGTMRLWGVSR